MQLNNLHHTAAFAHTQVRYFSRLWCTYELGAFLRLHTQKHVEVIPASFGSYLCIASLLLSGSFFVFTGIDAAAFSYEELSVDLHVLQDVLHIVTMFSALWVYVKTVRSFAQLSEQLSSFSIRDSQCFCCSVDHCMPDTGEEIPCDRRVVYGTLETWYSGDEYADPLESFDQEVRSHLKEFVAQQFGNGYFPIAYFFYVVMFCRVCLAFSFYGKDVVLPATAWLEVVPEAASPFYRCSKLIEESVNLSLVIVAALALIRLSGCMLYLPNRCSLLSVVILALILEGVSQLNRAVLLYFRYGLYSKAEWAALAYQLVLTIWCMIGIRVMASRSGQAVHK